MLATEHALDASVSIAKSLPCFMLCQWRWLMQQSILQVLRELLWGGIHQAVPKGANELVAGVVRTDDPLAHG